MSEKSPEQPRVVNLDICPYGDMEIVLITFAIHATYRVSSHQLCFGSPVFRAMLGPQSSFSEATGLRRHQNSSSTASDSNESLFQITAEEEHDPTALATVLYVLHGRTEHIPESVAFDNLLEIAIICDYYDCAAVIRPWDEIWMTNLRCLTSEPGYESWLFISWVFGNQEVFGQMTKSFSRNGVMVDGEFGIMIEGKVQKLDIHLPQGIINAMADQRTKIGQEIVTACQDFYTTFEGDNPIKCRYGIKECDYITFAGIHKAFKSKKLYPTDVELRAHMAPDAIVDIVKSAIAEVKISLQIMSNIGGYGHSSCNDPADELIRNLQSKLDRIEPLQLASFTKEPVASKARSEWERFLLEESTLTNHSIDGIPAFHLEVCRYGDMEIVLKTTSIHATYVVSSHQLRAASSTFHSLLNTGTAFQELTRCHHQQTTELELNSDNSHQVGQYQLELKKDHDPTALFIVFLILHARMQILPESVHFDNLVSVAAICDYYNISAVLQPWCGKWIDNWRQFIGTPGYEDWLFVSWVLRENETFQILTKKFCEHGIVEDNEFLIVIKEEPKDFIKLSKFTPQQIIDSITRQQNIARNNIATACRDLYEKYKNDTIVKCTIPNQSAGNVCDHFIFGELHMRFKTAGLFADNFSLRSDSSISSLVSKLNTLCNEIAANTQNYTINGYYHGTNCNSHIMGLTKVAYAALNNMKLLPLNIFGRKQVGKYTATWDSVLNGRIVSKQAFKKLKKKANRSA
ncbi:hypothetical protein BDD12DRAFT_851541 [Trichophaea hybrida]|nr:hypothetical protein BDD12DRAFT_851541 [Trichophaea hybrida]